MKKLKSRPLSPGAKIAIVAAASPVDSIFQINQAVSRLIDRGYPVLLGETAVPMRGELAGSDYQRQTDLERFWHDESIAAIWCLRGGYGSIRLLPRLWFSLLAERPKILIGFSDITALELGIWAQINLVTFHGPVLTSLTSNFSITQAFSLLNGSLVKNSLPWPLKNPTLDYYPIRTGKARGIMLGGNLATISSLIGTRFLPSFDGVILFLEEIHEAAYRIDRMMTQLILTGILDNVAAIIIGRCIPAINQTEAELIAVFTERLNNLKCPSAYGFPIGHIDEQWTIPQGVLAEVDMAKGDLILLESPFAE